MFPFAGSFCSSGMCGAADYSSSDSSGNCIEDFPMSDLSVVADQPSQDIRRHNMQRRLFILLLVTCLLPALLLAANGKIKGKVTDAGTGEPLVGANVVVFGTSMGAATNTVGEFVILNVPVGTYSLKTSYVGYQAITIANIRVNADLTTDANFQLPAEGVTVATVEIIAQRPLVNKSATNAVRIIDNEFFGNIPGRGTNIAIAVQPGVVVQNNNVYIRGSRPDEVGYTVDGVNVTNKLVGGNGLYIAAEAVEQIQIQAGGYNAEFGSANAGIVSSQLRTGSAERWHASFLAETDRYTSYGTKSLNGYTYGYSDYTASLGGPVLSNKLRFFGSVQNTFYRDQSIALRSPYTFTNLVTDPLFTPAHPKVALSDTIPVYSVGGNVLSNPSNRWAFAGTVTLDLDKLQVRAGGSYSSLETRNGTTFANYLNQNRETLNQNKDGFGNVKLSYLFSANTFIEANANYYKRTQRNMDPYWGENIWAYGDSALNAAQGWNLYRQGQAYGAYGFYNGGVTGMNQPGQPVSGLYKDSWETFGGRVDFSTQINQHLIKAGGEYSSSKYRRYNPVGEVSWAQLRQQTAPADLESVLQSSSGTGADVIGYDIYGNEVNSDVIKNGGLYYFAPPKPVLAAAYIQDKIELSDIILNIGLRWDYVDPDSRTTDDPGNLTWNADNLLVPSMYKKTPTSSTVSPRIGFSFPVSDRTVFHAQYGKFIQSSRFNESYAGPAAISGITKAGYWATAVTGWGLQPEKDTQYELGFAQGIADNASFDITAFYKDIRDQIQFIGVTPTPGGTTGSYHAMANRDFSTSKGVEFTFTLRRTQRVSAQVNYTFSDARSTASDQIGSNGIWQLGLGPASLPKYVFPVAFNQAHRGAVLLDYRFAKNDGGPILSQLGANLLLTFNSGHSYTRLDVQQRGTGPGIGGGGDARFRVPLEPVGSSTSPWFFQLDMRIDKSVQLGPLDLNLYIYAMNLLGTNNPINAFTRTGDPNNDGYFETQGGISDIQSLGTGFANLYKALNNGINFGNYGPPRQIRFGLKLDY
jgi:outer membrane receptor protein involved in Fe transport